MVNIDEATAVALAKRGGQDLHVARKHQCVTVVAIHQRSHFIEGRLLIVLIHWDVMEGDVVPLCHVAQVVMVRNNRHEIARQLTGCILVKQIDQAVRHLRHHHHNARAFGNIM